MPLPTIEELNALDRDAFTSTLAPLFEGAPRFLGRLAEGRPFETEEDMFGAARAIARQMQEEEQIELLDGHPRIGADPSTISAMSHAEQGHDAPVDTQSWVGDELAALNEAYEALFGFRFVVFVAGRPRVDIIPILEMALRAERDEELRRGLDDVVLIAADRWQGLRGLRPLPEAIRESIALEVSRYMVGESDHDGLIRATHRLIEEGVESPALLALSVASPEGLVELGIPIARLMSEIRLEGWDAPQAGQLLALHAAASILGDVSHPIDGARRIVTVSNNRHFRDLVERWEAQDADREAIDADIRRAAVDLFGEDETEA